MNEHFKRIIDDAETRLTELKKEAEQAADNARKQLGMLSEFAENMPSQMLDTCAQIFVGEMNFGEENKYMWSTYHDAKITICGVSHDFMTWEGSRGGSRKMEVKPGKYRVIVTLQKVE